MNGVPDDTYFGPDEQGHGISYGKVRYSTEDQKIILLELRLRDLLIKQINELIAHPSGRKVYAPIPLIIMTCVAIETLGIILFRAATKQDDKTQRYCFIKVLDKFDPKFSRTLSKEFKNELLERFPSEEIYKSKTRSDIIYSYFRNTFIHGYFGRAVYVEESIAKWEEGKGYLIINPNWFWCRFLEVFNMLFQDVRANLELTNTQRASILSYLNKILS